MKRARRRSFLLAMMLVDGTLRTQLLGLLGGLGAVTLVLLAWSLGSSLRDHVRLRADLRGAVEVNALIRLSYELRQEDVAVDAALRGKVPPLSPERAAAATDRAMAAVRTHLDGRREGAHEVVLTDLQILQGALIDRRIAVSEALAGPSSAHGPVLRRWRSFLDAAYPMIETISHGLIREAGTSDSPVARMTGLRHYTLAAFGVLIENRFAIEALVSAPERAGRTPARLALASASLRGAAHLAEDQFVADPGLAFRRVEAATVFLLSSYLEAEARLLESLAEGPPDPRTLEAWRVATSRAGTELAQAEGALAERSVQVLEDAWRASLIALSLWGVAFLIAAAVVAFSARLLLLRILRPMAVMEGRMGLPASGDGGAAETGAEGMAEGMRASPAPSA